MSSLVASNASTSWKRGLTSRPTLSVPNTPRQSSMFCLRFRTYSKSPSPAPCCCACCCEEGPALVSSKRPATRLISLREGRRRVAW